MKTKNNILSKISLISGLAVALAFASGCATNTSTSDQMKPMKGGEHQMMLNHIDTAAQAEALKPGDSIAMVCTMCKSVAVEHVNIEKGHIRPVTVGEKHLCPGCGGNIEVVGHGKGKRDVVTHTCSKCGDNSAFCCATKPGSSATMGMEKEKK